MAILTKPSISKGTTATLTLSLSDLIAHGAITDAFFQDYTNLSRVEMVWKSNPGNQQKTVKFEVAGLADVNTPVTSSITYSAKARDIHEIQRVKLVDKDGGTFVIDRSDLATANFDINLASGNAEGGGGGAPAIEYQALTSSSYPLVFQARTVTAPNKFQSFRVRIKKSEALNAVDNSYKLRLYLYSADANGVSLGGAGDPGSYADIYTNQIHSSSAADQADDPRDITVAGGQSYDPSSNVTLSARSVPQGDGSTIVQITFNPADGLSSNLPTATARNWAVLVNTHGLGLNDGIEFAMQDSANTGFQYGRANAGYTASLGPDPAKALIASWALDENNN